MDPAVVSLLTNHSPDTQAEEVEVQGVDSGLSSHLL